MSKLTTLLRDADPLRHERPFDESDRTRIWLGVLEASTGTAARPTHRVPLALTVRAVMLVALALLPFAFQLWVSRPVSVFAAVRFEMRLAEERPAPGLVVAEVAESDWLIYLHPEILVSNADVARAVVLPNGDHTFSVAVHFVGAGVDRMREATRVHIGKRMAILLDGKVVSLPVIQSRVTDSAVIDGKYTEEEAMKVAKGIGIQ